MFGQWQQKMLQPHVWLISCKIIMKIPIFNVNFGLPGEIHIHYLIMWCDLKHAVANRLKKKIHFHHGRHFLELFDMTVLTLFLLFRST